MISTSTASTVISYSYAAALPTLALRILAGIITAVLFSLLLPAILTALRRLFGEEKSSKGN